MIKFEKVKDVIKLDNRLGLFGHSTKTVLLILQFDANIKLWKYVNVINH